MSDSIEPDRSVLLIGVPGTGKTTFLALFYLALTEERATRLKLASWYGEREYLNEISGHLMRTIENDRTPMDERRQLDLPLGIDGGPCVRLQIPDLSGEIWEEALRNRHWTVEVEHHVVAADAKLLFLHGGSIDAGPSINQVHAMTALLSGKSPVPGVATDDGNPEPVSPEEPTAESGHGGFGGKAPTQIDLIDLVQLTCEQRGATKQTLGLVVSAWDKSSSTPEEFVSLNLPMLHEYLSSSGDWLDYRIFGVSAQGGPFDDPEQRKTLAEQDALDRSIIIDGDGQRIDVGGVIEWALGL